ncbi:zinc finger domain-containing protein [Streptomyces sp. NPDC002867]
MRAGARGTSRTACLRCGRPSSETGSVGDSPHLCEHCETAHC